MPKAITSYYLDDYDSRVPVYIRMIPELDDYGNVYLEIVSEADQEGDWAVSGRVRVPLHLADEFEKAWQACRVELEARLDAEALAEDS